MQIRGRLVHLMQRDNTLSPVNVPLANSPSVSRSEQDADLLETHGILCEGERAVLLHLSSGAQERAKCSTAQPTADAHAANSDGR